MSKSILEVDHIFIAVKAPAAEADLLKAFGLVEASANQHKGQGTANRRFFFHNMFLELLFITDSNEAQSEITKPTHLFERLSDSNTTYSPFGVCFRPRVGNSNDFSLPLDTWQYNPLYLPPQLSILMAKDNPLTEPMWFILPFGSAPINSPIEKRQPLDHPMGVKTITQVNITQPSLSHSEMANYVSNTQGFSLKLGSDYLVELICDEGKQGLVKDFRPALPLIIQW